MYIIVMTGFRATPCYNKALTPITTNEALMYAFYFVPTYVFLGSVLFMFAIISKCTVSIFMCRS